mmetsp:Transcript_5224/g.4808  ORF Transcript_5224/g.4808 Transcript_5224/m.4808 type:complete len:340 (-) Transcript_5224:997-2016(-)
MFKVLFLFELESLSLLPFLLFFPLAVTDLLMDGLLWLISLLTLVALMEKKVFRLEVISLHLVSGFVQLSLLVLRVPDGLVFPREVPQRGTEGAVLVEIELGVGSLAQDLLLLLLQLTEPVRRGRINQLVDPLLLLLVPSLVLHLGVFGDPWELHMSVFLAQDLLSPLLIFVKVLVFHLLLPFTHLLNVPHPFLHLADTFLLNHLLHLLRSHNGALSWLPLLLSFPFLPLHSRPHSIHSCPRIRLFIWLIPMRYRRQVLLLEVLRGVDLVIQIRLPSIGRERLHSFVHLDVVSYPIDFILELLPFFSVTWEVLIEDILPTVYLFLGLILINIVLSEFLYL